MVMSRASARVRFGVEVRRYRQRAGMTQQQLARALHLAQSHLSGVELGKKGLGTDQIPRLDSVLNADGALMKRWQDLYRDDGYAEWFRDIVSLESEASEIRLYQCSVVPGLFQTAEYAHTLLQMGHPWEPLSWVKEGVEARMKRQQVLCAERGPMVKVVIEEPVLRRPVGGRALLKQQLDKLLEWAEIPRVALQVVPADSERHYGMDGSFIVYTVPDKGQVAYTETRVSSDPRDDLESVRDYMTIFGNLCSDALPEQVSRSLIERIRRELDAQP